jgi:hypothetical protein
MRAKEKRMPTIFDTLEDLKKGLETLGGQLAPLQVILGKGGLMVESPKRRRRAKAKRRVSAAAPAGSVTPRKRRKFSPKGRAALKLAGRYMGLTRNLSAAQKAQVKRVREAKGLDAAIKLAASMRSR